MRVICVSSSLVTHFPDLPEVSRNSVAYATLVASVDAKDWMYARATTLGLIIVRDAEEARRFLEVLRPI